ncbi:MAG: hypothetical protein KBC98_00005 [Candidatus Pacebacteria bacterium]|nr:hypothetical protein [Candidatus Paceibacterota bacterium]
MKHLFLLIKRTATICLLIGTLILVAPPRAHAGIVIDLVNLIPGIGDWLTNLASTAEEVYQGLQPTLDKAAYVVGQATSQKLTTTITNSLNGSASGDEQDQFNIIEDFGKHFEKVAFKEGQKYVSDITSSTKNPFASNIGSSLVSSFSSVNTSALDNFSLGTVLGVAGSATSSDVQNKMNEFASDANVGGYAGLFALGMPENTPIGSSIIAEEELAQKIATAKENAKTELTSSGYTPKKTCKQGIGQTIIGFADTVVNTETVPGDCTIDSPSGFLNESGNLTVSSVFDRLSNVDSFGELLSSSLDQLAGSLISKGLSSINNNDAASESNVQYGGGYDVRTAEQNATSYPNVIVDFSKELAPAITQTKLEIDALQETINRFKDKESLQIPHDLDTCTPGPDRGWANRFDKYFAKQTNKVVEKATKDEDATEEQAALDYLEPRYKRSLEEARGTIADQRLNIPGVSETQTTLEGYSQKAQRFQRILIQLTEKKSAMNSLLAIISKIKSDPVYIALVLTDEDWNRLDDGAKIALYQESINENDPNAFFVSNPIQVTTIMDGSLEDIAMKKNVFLYQWDKWERLSNETDEGKKVKRELFLKFNEARSDMSSEASVARAEAFLAGIREDQTNMKKLLGQCILVRRLFGVLPSTTTSNAFFEQAPPNYQPENQMDHFETWQAIRVSDLTAARTIALNLRNANLLTNTAAQIQTWKTQLAALFPDLKNVITIALAEQSILDNPLNQSTLTEMTENLYGDNLRVPGAKTIGQILMEDAAGALFCKLPTTFDLNYPGNFDNMNSGVVGAKTIVCSPDNIISNIPQNPNANIMDTFSSLGIPYYRDTILKTPGVWYFSSGLDDYIIFDSSSAAGNISI